MRSPALALGMIVAACAPTSNDPRERASRAEHAFTSVEAQLLDFDFHGRLLTDAPGASDPRRLVVAQLLYSIGQLNEQRAVGRFERLELSSVAVAAKDEGTFEIRYHAKVPVAWGAPQIPLRYTFALPARVGESDQEAFAAKYARTCTDPAGGVVGPSRMFLFYRPSRPECALAEADVSRFDATVAPSSETTAGSFPEYDRMWADDVLDAVVLFGRSEETVRDGDEGVYAFHVFVRQTREYLAALQPDPSRRIEATTDSTAELSATLGDGRRVAVHVHVVSARLSSDGAAFDHWFDARTPAADLVVYNGHAGLGENVRTLMTKGAFRPAHYVIWAVNGCDTLAYVDRTLADRRALLNPEDPRGTKYMDQVSNVMNGYFGTGPAFAMRFLESSIEATRTYRQILEGIDPEQVTVVTGDEDNDRPLPPPAPPALGSADTDVVAAPGPSVPAPPGGAPSESAGCTTAGAASFDRLFGPIVALLLLAIATARRARPLLLQRGLQRQPLRRLEHRQVRERRG